MVLDEMWQAAQQEQIQAKYQAVLSIRLLDFYRNVPIEL